MTEQHPLTDQMCDNICPWYVKRMSGECVSMRAAYDFAIEQVIEWLYNNLDSIYLHPKGYSGCFIDVDEVISDLKEAMCPQQQEDL